jgi:uncharacterized membrane protein
VDWTIILLIAVFFIFVLPLWAFLRTSRLKRDSATREEQAFLTSRVYELERAVDRLTKSVETMKSAAPAAASETAPRTEKPAAVPAAPSPPATVPPPAMATTPIPPPPKIPEARPVPPPITPVESKPSHPPLEPTVRVAAPSPPMTAPVSIPSAAEPAAASAEEGAPGGLGVVEEKLGTNWLNKIGTIVFVIASAYLANYAMEVMGPRGKALLLYAIAAGLLGAGIFGERRERYRLLGRAALGGGWALAYFTTYAIHNIEAIRLIQSPGVAFVLLFLVAAAMVAHSLRYDSQLVTGFAYLLAFASVAVSKIAVGTLVANAVLAASLIVVLARRKWYVLELPAIAATYGVHWFWLWQMFDYLGGKKRFPEFGASVALLCAYWAIFTVSHFLREDKEEMQRRLLTGSFLLNVAGYLAVMRYQSLFPEWRFWFLLGVGIAYLLLATFSARWERRLAFLLASTLGAALIVIAIPYRYSGARLEIIWLIEAQALLIAGWRTSDIHLRKLGWAALGVLATYVMFYDLAPRRVLWELPDWQTGSMLLVLAAGYFLNGRFAPRLLGEEVRQPERVFASGCYIASVSFLLGAMWVALPYMWPAPVWIALGLAIWALGGRWDERVLRWCGHAAAVLAALRLLVVNMQFAPAFAGVSLRAVTVAIGIAIFYIAARRMPRPEPTGEEKLPKFNEPLTAWLPRLRAASAYSWTGTFLAALLIWNEVTNAGIGLAWALLGLALAEAGASLGDRSLVAQGHTLLVLSFARIFFADLNTERMIGPVSARLLTVGALAAMYYYSAVSAERPRRRKMFLWFGTVALASLLRFELHLVWVAVGWAVLALAAYVVAVWLERRQRENEAGLLGAAGSDYSNALRAQACLLTLFVGLRCAFDNFYQTFDLWFSNARTVTVVLASLPLYAGLALAILEKRRRAAEAPLEDAQGVAIVVRAWRWLIRNPQHLFFFVPTLLLTVLIGLEVRKGYLTAVWGLEAFFIFIVALKLGERAFRWFSLGLFLFCVGRFAAVDLWTFDKLGRIISGMGLGGALILVSFLYAKYKERLRQYL